MSPITDWEALAKDAKEANPGYEPAPEGNYNLTLTEVVKDIAKSSGNTKFSATMVIDSGPFKGKKVWHDFTVARDNKRALGIFFQNMATLGMPFEFFNANTPDEAIVANMTNKRISADLIIDTYNPDKLKNKIDKGWTIKEAKGPSELDLPSVAGIPGGAGPAVTNAPPPVNNYQAAPPQQYQQPPAQPQQPQYQQQGNPVAQQPPQAYQEQPLANAVEDPWQTPQSPPPPPSNANWGAPPPPPPGLS